jgi:hypothetical protein
MRILTHRSIEKQDLTPLLLPFLKEKHLMDVIACKSIRGGHEDKINLCLSNCIAEMIKPWAFEDRSAVAIVTIDVLLENWPALLLAMLLKSFQLLLDRLRLDLM